MTEGHIRGDGFSLLVNCWNKFRGGVLHKLKYKIYATLKDLPLFCWMADVVATIISSFGIPYKFLHWEDMSGFDVVSFYEEFEKHPGEGRGNGWSIYLYHHGRC